MLTPLRYGTWVYLDTDTADVIAVEVCGTITNLRNKQFGFAPAASSLLVKCPVVWLDEEIMVQNGGSRKRWRASESLSRAPRRT